MKVRASSALRACLAAAALLALAPQALAEGPAKDAELDALFARAGQSHAMLRLLLQKFPKGGDLHNHAGGSVYAEDAMTWAADKAACFSTIAQTITPGPCAEPGAVPIAGLADRNADLYSDVVDALSTRRFEQGVGDPTTSGHRRFFRSFGRFGAATRGEAGRVLAVSLEQTARDNGLYLELMSGPRAGGIVAQTSAAEPWNEAEMEARLAKLTPLIQQQLPAAVSETDEMERVARQVNACDTPKPRPGCEVTVRYLLSMSRENTPGFVFGQMAFAFALVGADPRYVGVNIVQPEDGPVSTRDYELHMRMFAFFKAKYPKTPLTLHAGELALGLTAPRDLRFHIREAVEIAGAKRIGHGVSIAYEDDAEELLRRMARDKIAVEINLTSNDVILGVKGADHPLALYLAAGVPVALSTDDEGVSRTDLTNEYLRAVTEHGLSYSQIRQISRDSLTYSFLEGDSLWDPSGAKLGGPCGKVSETPPPACAAFLKTSAKAREQWRLELALAAFEKDMRSTLAAIPPARLPKGAGR